MPSDKPLKKKVSITLDQNVVDGIQYLAEEDSRNFSQYINMVLQKHIKEEAAPYHGTAVSHNNIH